MLSQRPSLTPDQVKHLLTTTGVRAVHGQLARRGRAERLPGDVHRAPRPGAAQSQALPLLDRHRLAGAVARVDPRRPQDGSTAGRRAGHLRQPGQHPLAGPRRGERRLVGRRHLERRDLGRRLLGRLELGLGGPGTGRPGTARAGTGPRGTARPGTARPGTGPRGTARPGTARRWDGATWDGASWDGATWDGQGWDGCGWDTDDWDTYGWEGHGADRAARPERAGPRARRRREPRDLRPARATCRSPLDGRARPPQAAVADRARRVDRPTRRVVALMAVLIVVRHGAAGAGPAAPADPAHRAHHPVVGAGRPVRGRRGLGLPHPVRAGGQEHLAQRDPDGARPLLLHAGPADGGADPRAGRASCCSCAGRPRSRPPSTSLCSSRTAPWRWRPSACSPARTARSTARGRGWRRSLAVTLAIVVDLLALSQILRWYTGGGAPPRRLHRLAGRGRHRRRSRHPRPGRRADAAPGSAGDAAAGRGRRRADARVPVVLLAGRPAHQPGEAVPVQPRAQRRAGRDRGAARGARAGAAPDAGRGRRGHPVPLRRHRRVRDRAVAVRRRPRHQ